MGLKFAVITSVNRDDRPDGGAELFAMVIRAIRQRVPECGVEVLIPDFQGNLQAVETVMEARPDVLNHNTETVPRLYRQVRLGARYERSLEVLQHARRIQPETPTKSGLMLGLGETAEEVLQVMRDLRAHRVGILTLGQYLRPSPKHLPIVRYVTPAEFEEFRLAGNEMGFAHVESGPLVRSSYHAAFHSETAGPKLFSSSTKDVEGYERMLSLVPCIVALVFFAGVIPTTAEYLSQVSFTEGPTYIAFPAATGVDAMKVFIDTQGVGILSPGLNCL